MFFKKIRRHLTQRLFRDPAGMGRPISKAALDSEYASGNWNHFFSFDELPRNLVLAGALRHYFESPTILDVGCGSGRLASLIQQQPFSRYLGVDLSSEGIRQAEKLSLPEMNFVEGNYETWRPNGKFDAIIFNECIGYAEDPAAILHAFTNHLTPSGRFFLSHYRFGNHRAQWKRMERVTEVENSTAILSATGQIWDIKILRPRLEK